MKNWIQKILGIDKLIEEKNKSNQILEKIYRETKRNSDLVEAYNRSYRFVALLSG